MDTLTAPTETEPELLPQSVRALLEEAGLDLHSARGWSFSVAGDNIYTHEVRLGAHWYRWHPMPGVLIVDGAPCYSCAWL